MKNFTIIPNEILEESQLSVPARYLLCVLLRCCGQDEACYPGQIYLGNMLGYSDRHIRTLLNTLEKSGLIYKKRTGFNKSNTYTVAKTLYRNYSSGNPQSNEKCCSPQLGSKFPLHQGSVIPANNTYRKEKRNSMSNKGFESLRETMQKLNLRK